MKKRALNSFFGIFIIAIMSLGLVSSLVENVERDQRLEFGNVMRVLSIKTIPENLVPGKNAKLRLNVMNNDDSKIYNLRIIFELPAGVVIVNGLKDIKLASLKAGESKQIEVEIMASPEIAEGVYSANIVMEYYNSDGTERQDNDSFGIIVKSIPNIFAKVQESELYEGKDIGEVTIKFINNDIGNVKFLTVELENSDDFDIVSGNKEYIGDLDSDDFDSITFKIKKTADKEAVILPLLISYKDSTNEDYLQKIELEMRIPTKDDLGIQTNYTFVFFLILIIIGIIIFIVHRIIKKKK
ncbi:MAG: COG1361 S-layer family protein [Candidatus Nanoarchaeia archaeon]